MLGEELLPGRLHFLEVVDAPLVRLPRLELLLLHHVVRLHLCPVFLRLLESQSEVDPGVEAHVVKPVGAPLEPDLCWLLPCAVGQCGSAEHVLGNVEEVSVAQDDPPVSVDGALLVVGKCGVCAEEVRSLLGLVLAGVEIRVQVDGGLQVVGARADEYVLGHVEAGFFAAKWRRVLPVRIPNLN